MSEKMTSYDFFLLGAMYARAPEARCMMPAATKDLDTTEARWAFAQGLRGDMGLLSTENFEAMRLRAFQPENVLMFGNCDLATITDLGVSNLPELRDKFETWMKAHGEQGSYMSAEELERVRKQPSFFVMIHESEKPDFVSIREKFEAWWTEQVQEAARNAPRPACKVCSATIDERNYRCANGHGVRDTVEDLTMQALAALESLESLSSFLLRHAQRIVRSAQINGDSQLEQRASDAIQRLRYGVKNLAGQVADPEAMRVNFDGWILELMEKIEPDTLETESPAPSTPAIRSAVNESPGETLALSPPAYEALGEVPPRWTGTYQIERLDQPPLVGVAVALRHDVIVIDVNGESLEFLRKSGACIKNGEPFHGLWLDTDGLKRTRPGACTDPAKMKGFEDQFGGSDDPEATPLPPPAPLKE
jgi:hypothetical protein